MSFKPLGEIVSVKGGKRLPKGSTLQEEPNSHPYIRVKDMGSRYIPRSGLEFVPEDVFPKISRYTVNTNDVIISIVGTIGLVSVIDEFFDNASQTENCAKLTGLDKVDALYLYYFLRSEAGQSEIKMGTVGAVQAKLPLYNIEKLSIYWPLREVRQKIVSQLSTIDDKLECNAETNQTLEQIAQAIFKSWFVDFDPVKAKIETLTTGGSADDAELAAMGVISAKTLDELNSLKASNSEAFNKLAQTAALFPAAMQDSELGEIPEGWDAVQVGDIVQRLKPKKRYTKKQVEPYGKTPVYEQGSSILLGFHDDDAGFEASPEDPVFIFGDHTCITYLSCSKFDISSNVIPLKGSIRPTIWTYYAIQGKQEFQEYRRHWSEFIIKDVVLPSVELAEKYTELVTTKYLMMESQKRQSKELELLRDTLLPKLLSGEIDLTSEVTA